MDAPLVIFCDGLCEPVNPGGYACWAWLLSRYPAATVAPMSLLVPIVGFTASATFLGEPLPLWKIGATLLIMAGLAVNLLWRPKKSMIRGEAA